MRCKCNPDITIRWKHVQFRGLGRFTIIGNKRVFLPYKASTECIIELKEEDKYTEIAVGTAFCSNRDIFCKAEGRKRALAIALNDASFSNNTVLTVLTKPIKATIAHQYLKEHKKALNYRDRMFFEDIFDDNPLDK